ncbi:MAG: MFS transporter [Pseudolabrys sp.]
MGSNLRPISSLLLGVAFLLAGSGLQFTLLPLRGTYEGFSALSLGLIGSAYYIGFVVGCLLGPYLILRAGHIRAFSAMTALAVTVSLAYPLITDAGAWTLFRLVTGFCIAGFYLVIESWLNDRTSNDNRGLVMSAYVMVNFLALTVGQLMVSLYPIEHAGNFILSAMLASLAIVPVALTRSAQPAPITIVTFRPGDLYRAAPAGLVAAFVIGIANGAFWSLAPISAAGGGLNVGQVALFMSAATIAGAIAQWPIGRLSDRFDRRIVLLGSLVVAVVSGLCLWKAPAGELGLVGFAMLFGASTLPGYSLAAAHAYDKTDSSNMVATAATILLANALGASIGPFLAAMMMHGAGPRSLFLFTAITQALLATYILYRRTVQPSLSMPEKTDFDLAATAPVGAIVPTEVLDPADPSVVAPEPPPVDQNQSSTVRAP